MGRLSRRKLGGIAAAFGATAVSACSSLAGPLNAVLVPDEGYDLTPDIAYGVNPRHRLDVYTPTGGSMKRDVFIFLYGGSWKSGDRATYRFIGEALTSRGFVTVIPDYRLYPEVVFPAFVNDAASAVAWVRANIHQFGGEPKRIFLMGHSAGAHIAALLCTDRQYLHAAGIDAGTVSGFVGLAGPYAFDPGRYRSVRPVFEQTTKTILSQPVAYVDGGEPPMLLLHGEDDRTVNPSNSLALASTIERKGGQATVQTVADTGHIGIVLALAYPFQKQGGVLDTITAWIEQQDMGTRSSERPLTRGA